MDERLRLFAWIAGGGGCFGLLGAGFGAVTGFLCWRGGRAAGTGFGMRLARAFERTGERPFSPSGRGAIIGAVDGFLFLAVVGVLLGAIAGHGRTMGPVATAIVVTVLLLMAGALFFGGLAYVASTTGVRGVAALFSGAAAGGIPGYWLASATGLLIGVVGGAAVGILISLLRHRAAPQPRMQPRDDPPEKAPEEL